MLAIIHLSKQENLSENTREHFLCEISSEEKRLFTIAISHTSLRYRIRKNSHVRCAAEKIAGVSHLRVFIYARSNHCERRKEKEIRRFRFQLHFKCGESFLSVIFCLLNCQSVKVEYLLCFFFAWRILPSDKTCVS